MIKSSPLCLIKSNACGRKSIGTACPPTAAVGQSHARYSLHSPPSKLRAPHSIRSPYISSLTRRNSDPIPFHHACSCPRTHAKSGTVRRQSRVCE
ncbi:hypothetical protein CALCODRAFT_51591 [Calocera cornea HHB12733]|uniref:Uncharacterized protein n=1 Tax=Calocera cornea HHB12733 TaxID=1353952 RepID=A0A165DSK2_9BASI|nr:hypothetical protein CALCODRAFT_51591 [Calocera cornea HHB12733]